MFRPAGVDGLSLFEDASTELGGGASLLELLQTVLRVLSEQETLQRVEETALHQLIFFLRAGLRLQAEDLGHLLLQVAEQLHSAVCSLQPFLQHQGKESETCFPVTHICLHLVTHNSTFKPVFSQRSANKHLTFAIHDLFQGIYVTKHWLKGISKNCAQIVHKTTSEQKGE